MNTLRLATRRSALAVWQAEHVAEALRAAHPGIEVTLVPLTTSGDEVTDRPLASVGGKALFTRELERAILDGHADVAVHSMKDVPVTDLRDDMEIGAVMLREDPHDALVSNHHTNLDALPAGATLGTSSLRRECQLRRRLTGIKVMPLRGNVNTRLDKLDRGEYDAIVLAVAGLRRLGLESRVTARIGMADCLPAIGQGAIGIELRRGDDRSLELVRTLEHAPTRTCVDAERAVNAVLHGSCHAPIAAHAHIDGAVLHLRARVGMPDGSRLLEAEASGAASDPEAVGRIAGENLLEQGARELLAALEPA